MAFKLKAFCSLIYVTSSLFCNTTEANESATFDVLFDGSETLVVHPVGASSVASIRAIPGERLTFTIVGPQPHIIETWSADYIRKDKISGGKHPVYQDMHTTRTKDVWAH